MMKRTNFALFCSLLSAMIFICSCGGGGSKGGGGPTASVTVASDYGEPSPPDGRTDYPLNSSVTVSCGPTPYSGGTGTQYVNTGWTGGSGSIPDTGIEPSLTFTITVESSITWTWQTQYYLTVSSAHGNPQGAGWYDAGATAHWEVTSPYQGATGTQYVATPPTSGDVVMSAPATVTVSWTTQHYLTIVSERGGDPVGAGWYDAGTTPVQWSVTSPLAGDPGVQYVADPASGNVTMDAPRTVTVNWIVQYYLTVNSVRGNPQGEGWYNAGTPAHWSVTSPVAGPAETQYIASPASGDVTMNAPATVDVSWITQYYLTVNSARGNPQGAGWYNAGVTAHWSVTSPWPVDAVGTRYVATPPTSGDVLMDGPKTVTVVWTTTQYYLTIDSPHGNPQGAGWHNAGTTAHWSVTSPYSGGTGIQYVATPPTSGDVTMDAPKTATVSWTTQFRLTSAANPPAGGSVSPSGENWYNAGSTATLTATPNGEYIFYWSGDLSGTTNPQDLTISGPKSVTANFVLIPVADFSASPRSTIAPPLDVQFTDESAGNITSWEWDFKNDGTVDSTLQTPDPCTYASAGRYTVKLTVRGPGGEDSETKTEYIRVCEDANAIYVKTNGNDTLDGRTLANAVKTLQKAIDRAIENGGTDWSVRVSAGTYNIAGDWNVDFKGYAIHMACPSGTWTIDGLNAAGNRGFVFQTDEGAHSVVDNCTIQRCIAPAGDDGGAVYCTGASPTIINCRIGSATYGNKGDNAGGIYCYGGSNLTITNCTVQRNAATAGNGGGIYCDTSSPRISGCTIGGAGVQNTATGNNGGGIYCYHSNPRITDCTIEANEADVGAGIYCDGSSPLIATCTIKDNLASGTAGTGGGIYLVTSSNATITNCTIYGNSAGYYGGGIYSETSTPTISGCGIGADGANSAGDTGGGICLYSSSPVITNCTIKNNTAVKMGGGIECWNYSDAAITNCLIASNSTTAATSGDGNGGGVDIYDASPTLSNCTIADNTATNNGGGMNAFISAPVLNNTIVWGNIADSDASTAGLGNQIYADKSDLKACTVTLNYSDYANGTGDIEGTGTVTANNCINSDPLFVGGGDYHLDSITPSPCIDAGSNALVLSGVTTDIEGLPRIAGTVVDMGAYEYQP